MAPDAPPARLARYALAAAMVLAACHKESDPASPAASIPSASPAVSAQDGGGDGLPNIPPPPDLDVLPARAWRMPSGLATMVLTQGTGTIHPGPFDRVSLRFVGWSNEGKVFALSGNVPTSPPAVSLVHRIPIRGLAEGLTLMVAGEKRRMWIPANLGFRNPKQEKAPAGNLVFDVELVDVMRSPTPPHAPSPVAAAAPQRTRSGLRYQLLSSHRRGAPRPERGTIAVVNYTAWDAEGHIVDSTYPFAQPEGLRVSTLDAQWGEALSLMARGDTIRFWFDLPADFDVAPGERTLLAEVELLDVYSLH